MIDHLNAELIPEEKSRFTLPCSGNKALIISIASSKGLCGTYNTLIIKRTLDHIHFLQKLGFEVQLLLAGRKAEDYFKKREFQIYQLNHSVIEGVNYTDSAHFANELMQLLHNQTFSRIDVVYNHFRNAIFHELVTEQLLPIPESPDIMVLTEEENKFFIEPPKIILEPSRKDVVENMIPKFIQLNIYRILLDASASEHGARMTAMQKATDNATELLKTLTLTYNKVRQAMITREIVEIVSGAEVLNE